MPLTTADVLRIQADCLADDLPTDDSMLAWSENDLVSYFESGGTMRPTAPGHAPPLSIFTVTDIHVEHKENLAWLHRLPDGVERSADVVPKPAPNSVLLCCGDVATNPELLRAALRRMRMAYTHVFYVPGNHDVWCTCKSAPDSFAKLSSVLSICREEGVLTEPTRMHDAASNRGVWIMPLLSWHHASWDREPPLRAPPGLMLAVDPRKRHAASDAACCVWPPDAPHGSDALAARIDSMNDSSPDYARALKAIDDERAAAAAGGSAVAGVPPPNPPLVIAMSHMLPRQQLVPLKRHLFVRQLVAIRRLPGAVPHPCLSPCLPFLLTQW